ncbi:MAG: succinate dehydrogenase assembly factor 2 [Porticoccaceae bacterium]|jgi:antitoxin CptB|nr:succinate dehydrogenase assembly factor 2 [Porticoccaceae bacterium]MBT3798216.1 succinate dehydrogenase assembly factor 2 [Porticoccaceae bacterium]MBT4165284.1 succinate dehydrogenase assembly factor 2 [Porticoccaceae bacterium]MBT4212310.1 succinate dehydrogenase assembly factor 2 [Porticoccaceae bacterium]MBT4591619.1 succinate dehydrogenase assembly factor 2 [Porticoccaceae bacterium]|tara:strand:+ start:13 stop:270 length:258 start_codon:yes stop_codon:yes gene_type:complete
MNKNRLLWASRRGMLELDMILAPFVEDVYDSLEEDDKLRFEVLLEREDQTLFMWFMQREQPIDPNMQRILQIIRDSREKAASVHS